MTEQEQQVAIAEACGFPRGPFADYLHDWNAIIPAVNALSHSQRGVFLRHLSSIALRDDPKSSEWFATIAQWCEAFLRTVGKWKD